MPCFIDLSYKNFNSQPHEEADRFKDDVLVFNSISTHSLTRRLTILFPNPVQMWYYFNSQPHEEADGFCFGGITAKIIFQLTASRGG